MIRVSDLTDVADAFRSAAGVAKETTLSHRVFGDTKVLGRLRIGGEITVGRFNAAMRWFSDNWPPGSDRPEILSGYSAPGNEEDAA